MSDVHPENVPKGIDFTPLPIVTDLSDVHPENVAPPNGALIPVCNSVTLSGITIDVNDLQELNAA